MLFSILFAVCLILANLLGTKQIALGPISVTGGLIIFPVSYIINDCVCEVWGYSKARLLIWTGFLMNFFVVLITQLAILLPGAPFWPNDAAFRTIFGSAPRATIASLMAFLAGSTLNAWVLSRMKVLQQGKIFWLRAIVSSLVGECADSLIFIPIMFWAMGLKAVLTMMVCQVSAKVLYEILILPVTKMVVARVKRHEGIDTYDTNISYNPFKIRDL